MVLGKDYLPDIKVRCVRYKWSLQQHGAPSHTARNTETCSVRTFSSLSQTFCPPNSPNLNTVNLPSGVLFSRRSTVIKVPLSWQHEESDCQKHGRNYRMAQSLPIHYFLSIFYLRLMLFARWHHYFPRLIHINYGVMFRMKRWWFVPNLVKICSIFLKL